jgi:hypothetical protein
MQHHTIGTTFKVHAFTRRNALFARMRHENQYLHSRRRRPRAIHPLLIQQIREKCSQSFIILFLFWRRNSRRLFFLRGGVCLLFLFSVSIPTTTSHYRAAQTHPQPLHHIISIYLYASHIELHRPNMFIHPTSFFNNGIWLVSLTGGFPFFGCSFLIFGF